MARLDQSPGIRPRQTLIHRLDVAARHAFAPAVTAALMLLTEVPLGLPGQAALIPAVAIGSVWFWTLAWPVVMMPPIVFLIGLILDLRGYLPLGVGVLTVLIVHGFALRWRRVLIQQRFAMVWSAFLIIAAGAALMIWSLTAVLTFRVLSPLPALLQALVTAALYPVLAIPLAKAHHALSDPDAL